MQTLKGSVSRGVVSQRKCPTVTLEPMFARGAWVFCPSLRRVIKIQTANLSAGPMIAIQQFTDATLAEIN